MLLAKEAVLGCGNRFMDWNVFCGAALLMSENGLAHLMANMYGVPSLWVSVAIANLGELHRLFERGREGLCALDFIKLLKMGRVRKVTEPVDRVYGFLGLADEEPRAAAAPLINYSPERRREYWRTYADIEKPILQRDLHLLLSTVPSRNRPSSILLGVQISMPPDWAALQFRRPATGIMPSIPSMPKVRKVIPLWNSDPTHIFSS